LQLKKISSFQFWTFNRFIFYITGFLCHILDRITGRRIRTTRRNYTVALKSKLDSTQLSLSGFLSAFFGLKSSYCWPWVAFSFFLPRRTKNPKRRSGKGQNLKKCLQLIQLAERFKMNTISWGFVGVPHDRVAKALCINS
jgi:hypothetical protein